MIIDHNRIIGGAQTQNSNIVPKKETKIKSINSLSVVPDTKALVVQKTSFDVVIVKK